MTTPVASTPSSSSSDVARIAFVGGGNMARSLIAGLIRQGMPAASIRVAEPVAELRDALARDFGVQVVEDARTAVDAAATWVLAVKPQVLPTVCAQLAELARHNNRYWFPSLPASPPRSCSAGRAAISP